MRSAVRACILFSAFVATAASGCSADDSSETQAESHVEGAVPHPPSADGEGACPSTPACPIESAREGGGLVRIDRCAFPMQEGEPTAPALIDALERITNRVGMADVLSDLNRTATATTSIPGAPPGVAFGFRWASDDEASTVWIPQGISGSADATDDALFDGKRVVMVSWYNEPTDGSPERGVRVAVVDTTDTTRAYRFMLLVVPSGTPDAPSFVPLNLHAGGIVWYRDLLYVADTSRGFRVFDLTHILKVPVDADTVGCSAGTCRAGTYAYAVPQVASYVTKSACGPRYSFVSLDKSTDPPALVSGEYCSGTACAGPLSGRVFRWPLDAATGKLKDLLPEAAYLMGQRQVQGAAAYQNLFFLSSSAPSGAGGELYRVKDGASKTSRWVDSPEDLMVDGRNQLLYGLSEGNGDRAVFAATMTSYPAP